MEGGGDCSFYIKNKLKSLMKKKKISTKNLATFKT